MNPDPEETPHENEGEVKSEWITAPGDSHVDGFQLLDRSASGFGASSEIIVRFKGGKKNASPPSSYRYKFSKHNAARAVFDALSSSDHPGEVVHAELIKKNVPFIRIH